MTDEPPRDAPPRPSDDEIARVDRWRDHQRDRTAIERRLAGVARENEYRETLERKLTGTVRSIALDYEPGPSPRDVRGVALTYEDGTIASFGVGYTDGDLTIKIASPAP